MECNTDRIIVLGEYVGTGYGKSYESTRRVYDERGIAPSIVGRIWKGATLILVNDEQKQDSSPVGRDE